MRVFVAGGTGAIGRRLVPQLAERGHEVTATTTSAGHVDLLHALGAEAVVVDALDATAIGLAVLRAEPDAIVHELTALSGRPDLKHFDRWFAATNELRTKGTQSLLAAAAAAGVERVVAQSYTGWTNSRRGALVKTEDDPLDRSPAKEQAKSLAAIRFLEQIVLTTPLEGIALRYGSLYGPGSSEQTAALLRRRQWPVVGRGTGVWSWIHVDDAAAATVAAVERGARGLYNVVDDEPAPVSEWLPWLAAAVGAKPPRRVPASLARLALGRAGVQWMTEGRGASNAKAKRELGWQLLYPSWRDGFVHGLARPLLDAATLGRLIGPAPTGAPPSAPLVGVVPRDVPGPSPAGFVSSAHGRAG